MKLSLAQIKAMFVVGDKWQAIRDSEAVVIHGNTDNTLCPSEHKEEVRTVAKVMSNQIRFLRPNGMDIYTPLPKASEVLEASQGFVKIAYEGMGVVVALTKI